jgi:hypothetical protein
MSGRPTKYNEERAAAICKDIERGNTFRVAALANGIEEKTFYNWRDAHPEFLQQIMEAEAKAEAGVVSSLGHQIHAGDTRAIIFYLTHRNHDGWRPPKQTQEISGAEGGPIVVERTVYKGER